MHHVVSVPSRPRHGATYATGADAAITNLLKGCRQVQITNLSAVVSYVRICPTGPATAADVAIAANARVILTKGEDETVGRVFSAGAGSLHIICGNGL
jgi:hypothetical protein